MFTFLPCTMSQPFILRLKTDIGVRGVPRSNSGYKMALLEGLKGNLSLCKRCLHELFCSPIKRRTKGLSQVCDSSTKDEEVEQHDVRSSSIQVQDKRASGLMTWHPLQSSSSKASLKAVRSSHLKDFFYSKLTFGYQKVFLLQLFSYFCLLQRHPLL